IGLLRRRARWLRASQAGPEWHSGARDLHPFRLFRQRKGVANVQWLASPRAVPELGGCDGPTPTLELGSFGGCQATSSTPEGVAARTRASQKLWARVWDVSSLVRHELIKIGVNDSAHLSGLSGCNHVMEKQSLLPAIISHTVGNTGSSTR